MSFIIPAPDVFPNIAPTLNQHCSNFTSSENYFLICCNISTQQDFPHADRWIASRGSFSLPQHTEMDEENYELTKL